ncbi:MAG TPA: lactate racemase domain-containing protein [Pirellulales bacterium]|jgi:nickel-dependent lactate racemase|nr:lactate racemase domain-containing protein [Pirellulales bacterium]
MPCVVSFGSDERVDLDVPAEAMVAVCDEPLGEALADPAAAVEVVLGDPLNFPPLARAIVPGDRIVLALEHGVPQAATLVAAVAGYLVRQGVSPDHLVVLQARAAVAECDSRQLLPDDWRDDVTLEIHAPETPGKLSLLGSSHEGKPVYLNRTLLDADLVVPIGCLRDEASIGYHGRYGGLFPAFADSKAQQRYRKPAAPRTARETLATQREEIDEIGWLLGTQFTVQALPGGGGRLLRVLAGDIPEVFRAGLSAYGAAWRCSVPRRASLVVASLTGDPEQQTWENVGRALASASRVLAEGGAIALCTQLAAEPGPAVASLLQVDDLEATRKRIRREAAADALPATELVRALERGKVYLLSRLEETLVEDLGMAPMTEPEDVERLARRHESCIVLANAQHVVPSVEAEEGEENVSNAGA